MDRTTTTFIQAASPSVVKTGKSSKVKSAEGITIKSKQPEAIITKPDGTIKIVPVSVVDKKKKKTTKVKKEKEVAVCGDKGWCTPLILFIVTSIVVIVWSVFAAIFDMPKGKSFRQQVKYWLGVSVAFLIILVIIGFFFWWIQRECRNCAEGSSWAILFLAIIIPPILGLLFQMFVGAIRGGTTWLNAWLKKVPEPTAEIIMDEKPHQVYPESRQVYPESRQVYPELRQESEEEVSPKKKQPLKSESDKKTQRLNINVIGKSTAV